MIKKIKQFYKEKILKIKNNFQIIRKNIEKENNITKYLHYIVFIFISIFKYFKVEIFSVIILSIITFYISVSLYSKKYIYSSIEEVPYNDVALVLGTSKYLKNGKLNMYFKFRMDAAYELYKYKKIKFILVSGDNRNIYYNEPQQMREYLINLGVSKEDIFLDFAGFRTRDSIIRANKVFSLTNFTIVSQPFHNERAILIAKEQNINVIAYNANNVRKIYRIKQFPREFASRVLMFVDILTDKPPRFYGDSINIKGKNN